MPMAAKCWVLMLVRLVGDCSRSRLSDAVAISTALMATPTPPAVAAEMAKSMVALPAKPAQARSPSSCCKNRFDE